MKLLISCALEAVTISDYTKLTTFPEAGAFYHAALAYSPAYPKGLGQP